MTRISSLRPRLLLARRAAGLLAVALAATSLHLILVLPPVDVDAAATAGCERTNRYRRCPSPLSPPAAAFLTSPAPRRSSSVSGGSRSCRSSRSSYPRAAATASASAVRLSMASTDPPLRSITLPLLDTSSSSSSSLTSTTVVPLPSSHLPDAITTLNMYGLTVTAPVHKMLIRASTRGAGLVRDEAGDIPSVRGGAYGHLVERGGDSEGEEDTLVGGVGCAVDVVLAAPTTAPAFEGGEFVGGGDGFDSGVDDDGPASASGSASSGSGSDGDDDDDGPMAVLVRGSFRFVVREVLKTIPYPVVVVDELRDDDEAAAAAAAGAAASRAADGEDESDHDEDDDDDDDDDDNDDDDDDFDYDYDMYSDLTPQQLTQRTLSAMQSIVDQKLKETGTESSPPSPLEQSILDDAGVNVPGREAERSHAEEMGAVLDVFRTELVDICPRPIDVRFAVGMMAAELAGVDNGVRKQCLTLTDGVERLRLVLKTIEDKIGLAAAKRLTAEITQEVDEDQKELRVGNPTLPPWAKQIKRGTRVRYYWNEAEGWCDGFVAEDPVQVLDELVIPVTFDDDGSTHRLPFRAEEKIRWRPGDMA